MAAQYAQAAARISALALIDATGFDVCQQSCVDILADLLLRYVQEVGAGSHHYAELAGRSETNPIDVALALNDMSTGVAQLRDFVRHSQEVPFEQSISAFPLRKQSRPAPTFMERGEAPPPHIPPWLPALPDRHTYVATPVYPGHEKDPQKRQMLLTEQRQQAETAAVRLQARLAADSNQLLAAKLKSSEDASAAAATGQQQEGQEPAGATGQQADIAAVGPGQASRAQRGAAASNPFLAAPRGDLAAMPPPQPDATGAQAGAAVGSGTGDQPAVPGGGEQGPEADWEPAASELGSGSGGASAGFVAQQLFASRDWKAQQQRKARIATSGRTVPEAFGEAYDEVAAVRMGKRQKRGTAASAAAAAATAANDPTRARVEGILAASAPVGAPPAGVGQEDVVQEHI